LISSKYEIQGDPHKELLLIDRGGLVLNEELQKVTDKSELTVSRAFTTNKISWVEGETSICDDSNFNFDENYQEAPNKTDDELDKDPFFISDALPPITEEEETLKNRILGSVQNLYTSKQVQKPHREKKCRYCGKTGHVYPNCPKAKVDTVREVRQVRGIPASRLVPCRKGLLFDRQGYFSKVSANKEAFVRDLWARSGITYEDEPKEEKKQKMVETTVASSTTRETPDMIATHDNARSSSSTEKPLLNQLTRTSAKSDNFRQQYPIPLTFTQNMQTGEDPFVSFENREGSIQHCNTFEDSATMRCFFPPAIQPFLPRIDYDMIVHAFGTDKPLSKKDFHRMQNEIRYRREQKHYLYKMQRINTGRTSNLQNQYQNS